MPPHIRDEVDVYGVCLVGAPGVQIGTTAKVAWTHTFSRGHRFAVYTHELDGSDPTTYRFGDGWEAMTSQPVTVSYAADGDQHEVTVDRYRTRYGPVVNLPMVGWSPAFATSYRDANLANTGFVDQAIANAKAHSVQEYISVLAGFGAMPWATSSVADADGDCAFLDFAVTPNLSDVGETKFREAAVSNPLTAMALDLRVALFDGSDPDSEWVDDPAAPWPGTMPTDRLPLLREGSGVFNSNDPAWLCTMDRRIEPTPAMSGLDRRPVSPRTRANGLVVSRRWGSSLSGGGATVLPLDAPRSGLWDVASALGALTSRRSLVADLLLDAVIARCSEDADLAEAVAVLRRWDRCFGVASVGAAVWREFLGGFTKDELSGAGRLWAEGFDPDRPFDTPAGLASAPEHGPDPIPLMMRAAVDALGEAGVPVDAPLGDVQWVDRGERRIPMPGGCEVEGITDVMGPFGAMPRADVDPRGRGGEPVAPRFERTGLSAGGYPCTYGVSFVMATTFDEAGPAGRCLLAYGQSSNDESEHYWDQTEAWSRGEMRELLFHPDDVAAATLRTVRVVG